MLLRADFKLIQADRARNHIRFFEGHQTTLISSVASCS
jgi:hypothetical protein